MSHVSCGSGESKTLYFKIQEKEMKMVGPNNTNVNRMRTNPISVPRTMRRHSTRALTSLPAGKMVPLHAAPILREDAIRSGRYRFSFEHAETAEILMNAINVRVLAYFVPMLALERFGGSMDRLNLAYENKPPIVGQPVVPYIETAAFGTQAVDSVYRYLGLHAQAAQMVNTAYLEAYNLIWNFRAKNRSPELALRTRLQTTLAPAFWCHDRFAHMVPDFDNAVIDGKVPLNIVSQYMPVKGTISDRFVPVVGDGTQTKAVVNGAGYNMATTAAGQTLQASGAPVNGTVSGILGLRADLQNVFAELQANGITVSLSNIELARKTQAFAKLRTQYNEHDDHIINLLMDAISIPDQAFKFPMLVGEQRTIFGQSKRFATDGANLAKTAVNGMTEVEMSVQLPRIGTGGVLMFVAEITPDQLFERQEDPFLAATSVADLPQYLRDELDPEKVDLVKNSRIDSSHANPTGTFAYEPLNARWNMDTPRCGGLFYRPAVNTTFDEDRQRIWAAEQLNPTLSSEFYICTTIHTKPFLVQNRDPFECVTQGELFIEGNTVFGQHLVEATDDYNKVYAEAPQTRLP